MNTEYFGKIKHELKKEKEKNEQKILLYDDRARMTRVNRLENKSVETLVLSMFSYVLLFIVTVVLIGTIGISKINAFFPGISYPLTLVGSSLIMGTIGSKLFNKKYDTKKRFDNFSTSVTESEKLEEEVQYYIELQKANNLNKVIDKSMAELNNVQRYHSNYNIKLQSKEEIDQRMATLSNIIKEQSDELNILTTKKVLRNQFKNIRSRFNKIENFLQMPVMFGLTCLCLTALPVILVPELVPSSSLFTTLSLTAVPFSLGIVSSGIYFSKKYSSYKKAFNNLNKQLGSESLNENLNEIEKENFEELINITINELGVSIAQLKEQQYFDYLLNVENNNNLKKENEKDIVQSFEENLNEDNMAKSSVHSLKRTLN